MNYQLTEFAIGHMNDLQKSYDLAERLCPTVSVIGAHGPFKQFDDANSFSVYNTARSLGGDPTRITFGAGDSRYDATPQALEVTIDEKERQDAGVNNAVAQQLLDQGKIKALLNTTALSAAKKRVDFVIANTTAAVGEDGKVRGNFSDTSIDPIDQLDEQIELMDRDCGSAGELKMTLDLSSWRIIRSHPLVKKRLVGVQVSEISIDQFKNMLLVPVDIMVARISYIPTKPGQQTTMEKTGKKRLLQGNILLHMDYPSPTVYDPSPFKCFTTGDNRITGVRSYMAPNGLWGAHLVDWSEDLKKCSSLSMRRIALT